MTKSLNCFLMILMAKRSVKKSSKPTKSSGHQNFKLSAHGYPQEKVILYVVIAVLIGLAMGWFFKDQFISMLGGNPALY